MAFQVKETKQKKKAGYKTLYLAEELIEKVDSLAKQNDTSFNNIVVSMIEYCLNEQAQGEDSTKE